MPEQLHLFDEKKVKEFEVYDIENPKIWQEFEARSLALIRAGRKRIGAKMIFEVIRYFTAVRSRSDRYKVNNTYTPFYVRKFEKVYPQHRGIFQKRRAKADN